MGSRQMHSKRMHYIFVMFSSVHFFFSFFYGENGNAQKKAAGDYDSLIGCVEGAETFCESEPEKAIQLAKKGLGFPNRAPYEPSLEMRLYKSLCLAYKKTRDYESALVWGKKAIATGRKHNITGELGAAHVPYLPPAAIRPQNSVFSIVEGIISHLNF